MTAATLFVCSAGISQEQAEIKDAEQTVDPSSVEVDAAGQTDGFSIERFTDRFLLVDELPEDFPNMDDYESRPEFKEAVLAWCEANETLVNQEAMSEYYARKEREENANTIDR